jgi:hypothetical protein
MNSCNVTGVKNPQAACFLLDCAIRSLVKRFAQGYCFFE